MTPEQARFARFAINLLFVVCLIEAGVIGALIGLAVLQ